jgi:hypothetical protein
MITGIGTPISQSRSPRPIVSSIKSPITSNAEGDVWFLGTHADLIRDRVWKDDELDAVSGFLANSEGSPERLASLREGGTSTY